MCHDAAAIAVLIAKEASASESQIPGNAEIANSPLQNVAFLVFSDEQQPFNGLRRNLGVSSWDCDHSGSFVAGLLGGRSCSFGGACRGCSRGLVAPTS